MNSPLNFSGSVVLIAGDAGHTGKLIAEAFLGAGADVINCDSRRPESLPKAAGRQAAFTALDESDHQQIAATVDSVTERYGHLDVLVSVVADPWAYPGRSAEPARSDIRRGLITPLHFSQAANSLMQRQTGGGSIINVSCADGSLSTPQPDVLAAATAGLANLGSSLAVEWAPRVRVNTITLVLTQTEHPEPSGSREPAACGSIAMQMSAAMGQLPAVGNSCLFLASPLACYISGTHSSAALV